MTLYRKQRAAATRYTPAGASAVPSNMERKARERVSFFDFFSDEEKADALSGAPALDHTASMQKALDESPAGTTIRGAAEAFFNFRSLSCAKAMTLDFKGARLSVDPTPPGVTTGAPAIKFASGLGVARAIADVVDVTSSVVLSTMADAADFAVGDYVVVEDAVIVRAWDDLNGDGAPDAGSSSGSSGYGGRAEVAQIAAIDGATLVMNHTLEALYTAGTVRRIVSPIVGAAVLNVGAISEVDPGGIFTGPDIQQAPHLLQFVYCVKPVVDRVKASRFNLHVVNFDHCYEPACDNVMAAEAYRPGTGGHGYLMRFNRCTGGVAERCYGTRIRHVVDFVQSYSSKSQNNAAIDCTNIPFMWHGLGSKRCVSINDYVYDTTDSTRASGGWCVGNPSFAGDIAAQVIFPRYVGAGNPIVIGFLSSQTRVISPGLRVAKSNVGGPVPRGIVVKCGAVDTVITSGSVDMVATLGDPTSYCIFSTGKFVEADTFSRTPSSIDVRGMLLTANAAGADAIRLGQIGGVVNIDGNIIGGGSVAAGYGIAVSQSAAALFITNNKIGGTFNRAISVQGAPTTAYVITDNADMGAHGTFLVASRSASLVTGMNGRNAQTLAINGAAGEVRNLEFQTAGISRWFLRANPTAEGGANAGSDIELSRRADDGSSLGVTWSVRRDNGAQQQEAGGSYTSTFKWGIYHLWFDAAGRMRVKNGPPAYEADGAVIGAQA